MSTTATTTPIDITSPIPTLADMDKTIQPSEESSFEQEHRASAQMDSKSVSMPSEVVEEEKEETNYIVGMKLMVLMTGITVVTLLIMIDISIIATVGRLNKMTPHMM